MQRDNLFYIILGLIAVVLIGVTIGLQLMLLSGRSSEPTADSADSSALESNTTNQEQTSATGNSDEGAVSMVINTPTSTAIVIAVEPSDSNSQPTPTPIEPTSTAVLPNNPSADGAADANQDTSQSAEAAAVEPTPLPVQPTEPPPTEPPPTATPFPTLAPTDTPIVPVDFVFSYVDGRAECILVTEVVASLFETWGWSTRTVRFSSMDEVFSPALYENDNPMQPDLAFCYRDPEDREQFLSQNGTDLELISSGYITVDEQKYYVLAHSGLPAQLRYENPCILNFLKDLSFDDAAFTGISDAAAWTTQNIDLVTSWGTCEPEAQ